MLTLSGPRMRYCDRVSRRSFLQVGGLALGGLTLPQLLRAESAGGAVGRHKSVIMVYLSGGLAHQDTFDLKPEAPAEVRGEFKPIDTSVPGLQVCELLPRMAKVMDRCTLVRSVVGQRDEHSSFQNLTGYTMGETQRDGRPNFGSLAARVLGPTHPVVPPFVDLFPTMQHRPYNSTGAGYLGPAFNQIRADGEDVASMKLRYVEHAKFSDRRRLLEQIDRFRRTVDDADIDAMDESYHRAFDVLTSSRVVEALDLEKEDPKLRDRYGRGSAKHLGDGAPMWNDQLLIARRLVEAGVRVVTVAYGFWDTHGNNFGHMKAHLPTFDAGISSLIEDLHERGLERDCSVIVWGEFGRTPKINKDAGRDHWAPVQAALLAGGGVSGGRVVGATDKTAAYAAERPIDYREILASVYHRLGVDPHEFVRDANDRPVTALPEDFRPVRDLI
ncbi:DUF1501 domain-containing protein [Planctellipticum variicoloris]|uniref:DUF1501 domain-containing protein n=1 Tax=Planctellipticum variicoloris TaxID=3064265 RepID=UPI00301395D8|nr:DUF1501 domain-containing protein [Planctomycetaceae bacterium SH412]